MLRGPAAPCASQILPFGMRIVKSRRVLLLFGLKDTHKIKSDIMDVLNKKGQSHVSEKTGGHLK